MSTTVFNQEIKLPILDSKQIRLFVKREDLIHPIVSGNKFRKLKYNVVAAKNAGQDTLLTFGGAYSNHIVATAAAAAENNLKSIGVIRGEELASKPYNASLKQAARFGMNFYFVSRKTYRNKSQDSFITSLKSKFESFYLVPEGGTNAHAIKGCEEILNPSDDQFDIIATAVGTGGTISGLINSTKKNQYVLGFPALKGDFLEKDIRPWVGDKKNWNLVPNYHFGGYGKVNTELVRFINEINSTNHLPLDPVYTGKMLFGLLDLVKNGYFAKGTQILAIHTGGLQGIEGMNIVLKKKNLPCIHVD